MAISEGLKRTLSLQKMIRDNLLRINAPTIQLFHSCFFDQLVFVHELRTDTKSTKSQASKDQSVQDLKIFSGPGLNYNSIFGKVISPWLVRL